MEFVEALSTIKGDARSAAICVEITILEGIQKKIAGSLTNPFHLLLGHLYAYENVNWSLFWSADLVYT